MASFYHDVYEIVRTIPRGLVCTYGQVAVMAGRPGAARQVGWALHSLPDGTDVPWHRVINAKGGISLRGRMLEAELQQHLLEDEGIEFRDNHIDLEQYQFFI